MEAWLTWLTLGLITGFIYVYLRLREIENKATWWMTSLENRKADRGEIERVEGDEWKDGIVED